MATITQVIDCCCSCGTCCRCGLCCGGCWSCVLPPRLLLPLMQPPFVPSSRPWACTTSGRQRCSGCHRTLYTSRCVWPVLLVVPSCVHSRSSPLDSMLLAAHAPALAALQASALAAPSSCLLVCVVGFLRVVIFNALVLSTELYGIGKKIPVALQCNIFTLPSAFVFLCCCAVVLPHGAVRHRQVRGRRLLHLLQVGQAGMDACICILCCILCGLQTVSWPLLQCLPQRPHSAGATTAVSSAGCSVIVTLWGVHTICWPVLHAQLVCGSCSCMGALQGQGTCDKHALASTYA